MNSTLLAPAVRPLLDLTAFNTPEWGEQVRSEQTPKARLATLLRSVERPLINDAQRLLLEEITEQLLAAVRGIKADHTLLSHDPTKEMLVQSISRVSFLDQAMPLRSINFSITSPVRRLQDDINGREEVVDIEGNKLSLLRQSGYLMRRLSVIPEIAYCEFAMVIDGADFSYAASINRFAAASVTSHAVHRCMNELPFCANGATEAIGAFRELSSWIQTVSDHLAPTPMLQFA